MDKELKEGLGDMVLGVSESGDEVDWEAVWAMGWMKALGCIMLNGIGIRRERVGV